MYGRRRVLSVRCRTDDRERLHCTHTVIGCFPMFSAPRDGLPTRSFLSAPSLAESPRAERGRMPSRTDSIAGPLGRNRLLDMLPSRERERLVERTRSIPITPHDMLHAPGERIRHVYFPLRGVVSLMTPLERAAAIA